jgi:hypothetical protein
VSKTAQNRPASLFMASSVAGIS